MARRGEGGGRRGNDNFLAMIAGGVAGAILDYGWNSTHSFGWNQPIGSITAKGGHKVTITTADYAQLGISTTLGAYGFLRGGTASRIPAFAYGMAVIQMLSKFIFPTAGLPRYVAFDYDSQGRLVPVGQFG